jgi:synaptotagmin-4
MNNQENNDNKHTCEYIVYYILDPYVKIYMFYNNYRLMKKRTTIKRTSQCPVYNECFTFTIPNNDIMHVRFDFVVFDYDTHMKHEPIGMISIGHQSIQSNQHWIDVCQRNRSKQLAQWYQLQSFHSRMN